MNFNLASKVPILIISITFMACFDTVCPQPGKNDRGVLSDPAIAQVGLNGKNFRKALQGTWICSKIVNSSMQDSYGKFGDSGTFLKFEFKGNRLYIATAPYDDGMEFVVTYSRKDSMIYLPLPYSAPEIEPDYKVSRLSDNMLILDATNGELQRIHYIFLRQRQYKGPEQVAEVIDCGIVRLQQLQLMNTTGGNGHPYGSEYHIRTTAPLFYPVPEFRTHHTSTYGYIMAGHLDYPEGFAVDSLSKEMILEFTVSGNGAEDIEIISGIDLTTDKLIMDAFLKTRRKWQPVKIGREKVPMRVRIHIYLNKKRLNI